MLLKIVLCAAVTFGQVDRGCAGSVKRYADSQHNENSIYDEDSSIFDEGDFVEDDPYDRPLEVADISDLGLMTIDGDIVVPIQNNTNSTGGPQLRKGLNFNSIVQGVRKWPDGVVSYWFNRDLTRRHRHVITESMKHWEENTCIKFERAGALQMGNYVNIRSDRAGCFSMVGRVPNYFGPQILNLGQGCVSRGTVVHELGHAIGFFHEQSRSDRDQHIRVLWHNVNSNMHAQFAKALDNSYGVPYDYSSVMQYQEWAFQSDPEKNTIVTLDPLMQLKLGNTELSFRDRKTANAMYNCAAKCPNVNDVECENEGYLFQPYGSTRNCSCVCPPNASGDRCETLLNRSYYEPLACGGNITTEGPIQTPNAPYTTFPDGGCVFWIQAPADKIPKVSFSDFSFQGRRLSPRNPLAGLKCARERVEIRTSNIFEGKMYCSSDLADKEVTSSTRNMVIVVTPKHSGYPGGFRAAVSFVDKALAPPPEKDPRPSGILATIFGLFT